MDFSQNARELEIQESEYVSLLGVFESQTHNDLMAMEKALADSDLTQVYAAAHSIKGASGSLNLWKMHEAAAEICTCANEGSTEPIGLLLAALRSEFKWLTDRLSETREGSDNG